MNIRIFILALMMSLICAAPSTRLMAEAAEDKCEKAIVQEVKGAKKPKKVIFASDTRRAIPHGPLTHYAGKGSYVMPGGDRTEFEWFCDVNDASGKPTNLHYTVSKTDAPAPATAPPPKPKDEATADETWVRECQNAVASEIKKKNSQISNLAFHSAKEFQAGKKGNLLEGAVSFQGKNDEEMRFDYRCTYDKLDGKITAKSVQMK